MSTKTRLGLGRFGCFHWGALFASGNGIAGGRVQGQGCKTPAVIAGDVCAYSTYIEVPGYTEYTLFHLSLPSGLAIISTDILYCTSQDDSMSLAV